jgi:hypothetical protein
MIRYANPLYDTVFKYLIEDLSIAREFLSIILDVEVLELEVQPQEVSVPVKKRTQRKTTAKNEQKGNPKSLIRYDFKAKIVQANGEVRTILLELQKRNHKSIIFRFRNYVARNYSIETGAPSFEQKYIYLTGFPIDSTQELPPYLWCRRQLVDGLTGNLFFPSKGINFVDELTHESCFIHVNGFREDDPHPVAQVINLFNQKRSSESPYILEIAPPQTGTLMARIVDRLYKATHDDELMKAMELESYYEYDIQSLEDDKEALRLEAEAALLREKDERRQKEEAQLLEKAARQREKDERRQKKEAQLLEKAARQREKEERQQKEEERQQKEEERRQKETIIAASVLRFHALGLSIDEIANTLGITTEKAQRILDKN